MRNIESRFITLFVSLSALLVTNLGVAQVPKKVQKEVMDENWSKGVIILKNGEIKQGEIDYKEIIELVYFKGPGEIKSPFTADQLNSFLFFEESKRDTVKYIVLPFDHFDTGQQKETIFRILYESSKTALLEYKEYQNKKSKTISYSNIPSGNKNFSQPVNDAYFSRNNPAEFAMKSGFLEMDVLFIANNDGFMERYLKRDINSLPFEKYTVLDKKLLKDLFGKKYELCKKYAKKNKLSLKDKYDLIEVLKYFDSL